MLRSGDTGSRLYLMSAGIHQALAFVKTIENKLHPRRDSKFFEDFLQIISDDRMLARGWSQRAVALVCYAITAVFVALATWGVRDEPPRFCLIAALSACLLTTAALRLGCLRPENRESPHQLATHETRQVGKTSAGFD